MPKPYRIVAISDTHEMHQHITNQIPECDLLIHAGDITWKGDLNKLAEFSEWCYKLQDEGIVKDDILVIAGNHDIKAETMPEHWLAHVQDFTYLRDEFVVRGPTNGRQLKIYGSPWTPSFFRQHWAFNADRGEEIRQHWAKIPDNVDILVTHGPPYGVCDLTPRGERVGCADLRSLILRKAPKLHICGHIHEGYGTALLGTTLVMNASTCTGQYKPTNSPLVVGLDLDSM